jgi:dTDP-4-dehydrorhamnose reductase/beta-phosphoglucomutase-like phosphatase (HAD superfamily)
MILICGASGLVGSEMCKLLDDNHINYFGTYNNNKINKQNMFQLDFSNPKLVEDFLLLHKISCCIFCIVERLTDVCENNWNEIKKTNIDFVHIVSYLCNKINIKFIHISTDYVFDGSNQPNFPESLKNPLQNYGISKLISEYRVLTNCKNYCIIRTPVLYSSLSKIHDNAVSLIGKNVMDLRTNKYFKEDNYSIRRPLYISDLCIFIYNCYKENYNGIYHFYNPYNKYTKYEICQIIARYLNIEINKISPNNTKSEGLAPRPYDTQLQDDKYDITKYKFQNFDETIETCFKKFNHPKITSENKNDFFICLDMDGTIIDTNMAHYNCYKKVFEQYNKTFLNINQWNNIILNDNIDNYLRRVFNEEEFIKMKNEKREYLKNESISFTKNSELFLKFLIQNDFNFCIVTNTNEETVKIFKEKFSLLNEIKQWIYREDYNLSKPDGECYKLAKEKYYKNEKYIIGIEDSMVGYNALKCITDIIYIYNNETVFKNNDCYIFDDYVQIA